MTEHPDWGHGPNQPVLTFTEWEIRAALDQHCPCADYDASIQCCNQEWTADHLIDVMKKARD